MDITLFEKEASISSGPPYCHLHAGGNLYREISDKQCVTLLKQSIEFVRSYPFSIDYRPTVIALPKTDKSTPEALLPHLNLLTKEYKKLIEDDPKNNVLGESQNYYKLYERERVEQLQNRIPKEKPNSPDEWMVPAIQQLDLEKLQFPLILVQEYGINLFRFASGLELALLEQNWDEQEIIKRTSKAINHLSDFIPRFKEATVGSKPLFGAQQIPGNDPTLRVAEVSFPTKNYARCEIVKVSSSLEMIDAIINNLLEVEQIEATIPPRVNLDYLNEQSISTHAQALATLRDYPSMLAGRIMEKAV